MTIVYYKDCACRDANCKCQPRKFFCNTGGCKTQTSRKIKMQWHVDRIIIKECAKEVIRCIIVPLYSNKGGELKPPPVDIRAYWPKIKNDVHDKFGLCVSSMLPNYKWSVDNVVYIRWRAKHKDAFWGFLSEIQSLWESLYENDVECLQSLTQPLSTTPLRQKQSIGIQL